MKRDPEQLLNASQLAARIGVDVRTVVNWSRKGLPSAVWKARRLYLETLVREWMQSQDWIKQKRTST